MIIIARTVSKLEAAIKAIQASALEPSKQRFHHISADLRSPQAVQEAIAAATTWNANQPPDIVFCCAGSAHPGHFAELSTNVLKEQIESDYLSTAYTAHASIQAWLSHAPKSASPTHKEPKHLIFFSSLLAFLPLVGYSSYTPAKTALRALSETLSQELLLYADHTPIETHCVFPGTIFTAAYEREQVLKPDITKKLEESDGGQTPKEVAEETIRGLERGEGNVVTSGWLGSAMRAGMLGASRRRGLGIVDTILAGVVGIVLIFVRRDMDAQVAAWGKAKMVGQKAAGGV